MEKIIKVHLANKTVILITDDADDYFDSEDILRIDHSNIIGELLTFPVIVNRVGVLKAEAEYAMRKKKLECSIFEADLSEKYRKSLVTFEIVKGGVKKAKPPVLDSVNNAVKLDDAYKQKMLGLYRAERNCSYIDSLYWSVKSKDDKLKALSHHIPKDFEDEIIEGVVNGIQIKVSEKPFKTTSK